MWFSFLVQTILFERYHYFVNKKTSQHVKLTRIIAKACWAMDIFIDLNYATFYFVLREDYKVRFFDEKILCQVSIFLSKTRKCALWILYTWNHLCEIQMMFASNYRKRPLCFYKGKIAYCQLTNPAKVDAWVGARLLCVVWLLVLNCSDKNKL